MRLRARVRSWTGTLPVHARVRSAGVDVGDQLVAAAQAGAAVVDVVRIDVDEDGILRNDFLICYKIMTLLQN